MTGTAHLTALDRYRDDAERLGKRFRDLNPEQVLEAVLPHLPRDPVPVLDVGAGSGRDADYFAAKGHAVTAVEPVPEMSKQAQNPRFRDGIHWVKDHLPDLEQLNGQESTFGLALLSGVWHHLPAPYRQTAFHRLAALLRPGGRLILSLRLGPDTDERTNFAIDADQTITDAQTAGLTLIDRIVRPSIQPGNIALGVQWVWLVLDQRKGPTP